MINIGKAFEMVSHIVVLQALVSIGINGNILEWLQDLFTNRSGNEKFQNKNIVHIAIY